MLDREELIEQAYFFRVLGERTRQAMASQEVMGSIREEILATTDLPKAIDFLNSELRMHGVLAPGMARLPHYFTPFQVFVVASAEDDRGQFDLNVGLEILRREAEYRAGQPTRQGLFLYHLEAISRNRLRYDRGLQAVADDPLFDDDWREWILTVRRQVGLVDVADLIYVRSQYYQDRRQQRQTGQVAERTVLFGEKEGRIALANRRKDPTLLFSAMHRQLGYPEVPRPVPADRSPEIIAVLVRRLERMETRLKLLEDESKGGIDIQKYYVDRTGIGPDQPAPGGDAP